MNQGRGLETIAAELERQVASKRDYLVSQGAVEAKVVDGEIVLDGLNGDAKVIAPYAHKQFADHLAIPARYYERMRVEQPQLLVANLNTWLQAKGNDERMIRTLGNRVRAFLSPKFRPLDNFDVAKAVLPVLSEFKAVPLSAELTETRLYIKAILPSLSDELPEGMTWGHGHQMVGRDGRLVAALTISNSEVGAGALRVEPSVFTTWCTNLAIMMQAAMKRYHVGKAWEADEDMSIYRDATREADDKAFFMKVVDVTRSAFNEDTFKAAIASIKDAGKAEIKSSELPKVVEKTVKLLALPEATTAGILTNLVKGMDLTQWGLSSAITQVANTNPDYEGSTELERAGGKVLALTPKDWAAISEAA